jgi:hypothetical protein
MHVFYDTNLTLSGGLEILLILKHTFYEEVSFRFYIPSVLFILLMRLPVVVA